MIFGCLGKYIGPLLSHGPKPLIFNGSQPSNCPHRQLCAAAHFRSFVGGGSWTHRLDNTFPDWSGDRKSLHTGSMVCGPFYEKAPLPILCPTAGPQFGNICRPAIWRYSGRRRGHPTHHPTAGSSHCHCCSTHVPAFGPGEIVDSLNEAILTFSFPSSRFAKRTACFTASRPEYSMRFFLCQTASFPSPAPGAAYCAPGSRPAASAAFPSPPVPPAWVRAWAHRISR